MKSSILKALLFAVPLFGFAQQTKDSPYRNPENLAALITRREGQDAVMYILVDVRTPEEYRAGHIATAVNIPVSEIGQKPPAEAKDALIIVYCRSGARSASARQILENLGYANVVDFGGVSRWTGTLVRGDKPTAD